MNISTPQVALRSEGTNENGFIERHVATFYIDGEKHERVSFNQDGGSNGFYWAELMADNIDNILSTFSHDTCLVSPDDAIEESIALGLGYTGVSYVK